VLVCELADPTPLRISPCTDSLSSPWGATVSGVGRWDSLPGREAGSSTRIFEIFESTPFVSATDCMLGESKFWNLTFSRSFALSLAARGAEGKNCAKLAPEARDIVTQKSIYHTLRLPTNISDMVFSERLHASKQRRRWPCTREGEGGYSRDSGLRDRFLARWLE
jgi:hypothetical protein